MSDKGKKKRQMEQANEEREGEIKKYERWNKEWNIKI